MNVFPIFPSSITMYEMIQNQIHCHSASAFIVNHTSDPLSNLTSSEATYVQFSCGLPLPVSLPCATPWRHWTFKRSVTNHSILLQLWLSSRVYIVSLWKHSGGMKINTGLLIHRNAIPSKSSHRWAYHIFLCQTPKKTFCFVFYFSSV